MHWKRPTAARTEKDAAERAKSDFSFLDQHTTSAGNLDQAMQLLLRGPQFYG